MTPHRPSHSSLETPRVRGSYVGCRRPGLAAVCTLAGEHLSLGGHARSDPALAAAVLTDHLGRRPAPSLAESFQADWITGSKGGEFFWPVEALDAWLAAQEAPAPVSGERADAVAAARPARVPSGRQFHALRRTFPASLAPLGGR